ncbi:polysaccharide biosynthesis protein [Thalassotalea profundi]|uniref:Nucleoside-diphosphate sugar epimerase n=1 Tax=Thalassotalea profundi TaxID=2036687 RepID=A0ABQ3INP3_9GAMM|nr:nucleoside-diphosphate sugar epimerase/dehydratase [Thalassotalea profundi]GHE89777.1 nucleoside-diphosphate sugar epimerase [Thalassotalea profundi]
MIRKIDLIPRSLKLMVLLSYDLFSLGLAFFLAYLIRLGASNINFTQAEWSVFITVTLSTMLLFYFFGTYRTIIRYFNARTTLKTFLLLGLASLIFYLSEVLYDAFVPLSVPIVFFVISSVFIAGARALFGLILGKQWFDKRTAVIIYGAGKTGQQLANSLTSGSVYQPVAFIDEKSRYHGRELSGIKVFSTDNIEKLTKRYGEFKVLIALSHVGPVRMKEIIATFEPHALELLSIPSMADIVSGKQKIDQLREVSVDELLGREAVTPVADLMHANIKDKVVMVSGAGGSIGKELCRQIIKQGPTKLVLLDVSEAFLYEINQELSVYINELNVDIPLVPLIGNVQHGMLMSSIFHTHKVQTIYHAAAYKHVPLVEGNVIAGIANNILGTYEIAQAAIYCDVETFVLISTDKAVRPTNVMGATKRMAELVLQSLSPRDHNTRFVMVRFGNVLGSSGSVVPLFKRQIKKGGPITVTHPDIIRYFMTIPEAAQLVIQAGAMGKGGDVFVLDMGKPVKIIDLAIKMTHLMGLTIKDDQNPNGDIEINYSGLRPGEKLYEELLIDDHAQPTDHQRILTANERSLSWPEVNVILNDLNDAMRAEDVDKLKQILLNAPLEYQPEGHSQHNEKKATTKNSELLDDTIEPILLKS